MDRNTMNIPDSPDDKICGATDCIKLVIVEVKVECLINKHQGVLNMCERHAHDLIHYVIPFACPNCLPETVSPMIAQGYHLL